MEQKPLTESELAKAIENGHKAVEEEKQHKLANKQLAIIKNVRVGWDDNANNAGMQFEVKFSENESSVQFLGWGELKTLLEAYKVYNINVLENFPCWIYVDPEKGKVDFLNLCVM